MAEPAHSRPCDAVILDLVGVMTTSPLPALEAFVLRHALDPEAIRSWFTAPGGVWSQYECGRLDEADIAGLLTAEAGSAGPEIDVADFVDTFLSAPQIRLDMLKVVAELRRGATVACLTNTVKRNGRTHLFGLPTGTFDLLLASCEMGYRKPNPQAFVKTCRALGTPPQRCLFLDDDAANVEAARLVGLTSYLVPNVGASDFVRSALGPTLKPMTGP